MMTPRIFAMVAFAVLITPVVLASYTYPTGELMDAQFSHQIWGTGTLDGRAELPDQSVEFAVTLGTGDGKTVIGDDWQVAASAGLGADDGWYPGDPGDPHALPHSDVSIAAWDSIALNVLYASGTGPIDMKLFMNTGMTGPSGYPVSTWQNNTAWTGPPQTLAVGEMATLVLDFDNAQAWSAGDNPYPHSGNGDGWTDGEWYAVNERDLREVTNLGFEVYGPADSAIVLRLNVIPEPGTGLTLFAAGAALLSRRQRKACTRNLDTSA